ncbi:MAG: PAS domain-containing protein [Deltaproteobacteria bacterium]|nr:PAS domain-containing protein [Deltaproteobacteria bacterium]
MVKAERDYAQRETLSRLQLLMFARVGLVSLLLGVAIIIQVRETKTYFGEILNAHYSLIALIYLLTFFYVVALKYIRNLARFAYIQLVVDTAFITAIIYTTGGIESIFSFLYQLIIIAGAILLYRRGGLIIASLSSILYGAFLDLSYYGVINPLGYHYPYASEYQVSDIFYMILVNVAAFYLVAILSSFLSEQIRRSRAELRARQKDLADLEILQDNIIQSISSGLIALDENGRIIAFNKGAEEIFRVHSRDAVQRDVSEVIPFVVPYLKAENQNKVSQLTYKGDENQRLDLLLNVSPLKGQGGDTKGELLIFQDTTRLMEMEREVKRMEGLAMLGELAAGVAHEIRNPLASISGSIQVLNDSLSKGQAHINKRLMEIVLREVDRLNHLVSDFLQFARPQRSEVEEFDLNQLIKETLYLFQTSQKWPQKLKVETNFREKPLVITSDPQQLKQVLWNVFLNACEAMPDGGTVRVSTERDTGSHGLKKAKGAVSIKVEDTGPGIDASVIDDMFKPFSTAKKNGSGLGLAIVKKIVENLGGEVSGYNLDREGAAIAIVLPPREGEPSP